MVGIIAAVLLLISIIFSIINHTENIYDIFFSGASDSISFCLKTGGIICLFCGIMNVSCFKTSHSAYSTKSGSTRCCLHEHCFKHAGIRKRSHSVWNPSNKSSYERTHCSGLICSYVYYSKHRIHSAFPHNNSRYFTSKWIIGTVCHSAGCFDFSIYGMYYRHSFHSPVLPKRKKTIKCIISSS